MIAFNDVPFVITPEGVSTCLSWEEFDPDQIIRCKSVMASGYFNPGRIELHLKDTQRYSELNARGLLDQLVEIYYIFFSIRPKVYKIACEYHVAS